MAKVQVGAIARNKTGDRIMFTGSEWVPVQTAKNAEGQRVVNFGQGWVDHSKVASAGRAESGAENELSWLDALSQAGENFLPSAEKFGSDMWDVVSNPLETAKGLGGAVAGYAQKAGESLGTDILGSEYIQNADAINQYFADRYGGLENVKRSFATDPVGVAADVATLFTGGGGALRGAASGLNAVSKARPVAGAASALRQAGTIAGNVGRGIDPLIGATRMAGAAADASGISRVAEAAGQAARSELHTMAQDRYLKSLRPQTATTMAEKRALADVGLEGKYLFNDAGVERFYGDMGKMQDDVKKLVDARTALEEAGTVPRGIDPWEIAARAEESMNNSPYGRLYDPAYSRSINNSLFNFLENTGGSPMTTGAAHQMKNDLSAIHSKDFNRMTGAKQETNKALRHHLKEAVESTTPEVAPLNAKLSRLHDFEKDYLRASGRAANNNTFGLLPFLSAGAAGVTGASDMERMARVFAAMVTTTAAKLPNLNAGAAFLLDSLDGSTLRKAAAPAARGARVSNEAEKKKKKKLSLWDGI